MKGMSRVLFIMKASFMYMSFAINKLDPMWKKPIAMKKRIETFFMFLNVSIGKNYTEKI